MLKRFRKDTGGATAIEYGLIVAVLSLAVVAGVGTAGNSLENLWGENNRKLHNALNP